MLLADEATAYVVVTSPRPDAIDEARFFSAKLRETGVTASALIVNRVHPHFMADHDEARDDLVARSDQIDQDSALVALVANLVELESVADREESAYRDLVAELAPAPVGRVPLLGTDVHDLAGLGLVADQLFAYRGSSTVR